MNSCPKCGTQYTDQTLSYCLQDGTPLIRSQETETPTVLVVETETKDRIANIESFATQFRSFGGANEVNEKRDTGTSAAIKAIGALAAVILVAAIGIGGYWIGSSGSASNSIEPAGKRGGNSAGNTENGNRSVAASSSPAPNTALTPATPTPFDDTQAKGDLTQRVRSWQASIESLESDSIVENYTPVIENYYGTKRAKSSELKKAKAKKLKDFDSLIVEVSGQDIRVDRSGTTATVEFDREIRFQGKKDINNKTRVEMKCRLVNGRWLIYSERDIKTYPKK